MPAEKATGPAITSPVSTAARRVQRDRVLALGRHVHDARAVDQDLVLDAGLGIDARLAVADRHRERGDDAMVSVCGDGQAVQFPASSRRRLTSARD